MPGFVHTVHGILPVAYICGLQIALSKDNSFSSVLICERINRTIENITFNNNYSQLWLNPGCKQVFLKNEESMRLRFLFLQL